MSKTARNQTTACVTCGAKAVVYSGHVIACDGESICAGWCADHVDSGNAKLDRDGCAGMWSEVMGCEPRYTRG